VSNGTPPARDTLDNKANRLFAGKVVRKDLVRKVKVGANVPVFVLEFLLGKYCTAIRRKNGAKMKRAGAIGLYNLPLFATDDEIGSALLGVDRVQEWRQIAGLLEQRGLPKIDSQMGGRYMRAVVAFFDRLYGLDRGGDAPLAPDGAENFEKWRRQKHHS
jgi:hypothetical protein